MTTGTQKPKSERTYDGETYENVREYNLRDANDKTAHDLKRKQLEEWLRTADQVWEDSPDRKHFENGAFEVEYAVESSGPSKETIYWTITVVDDDSDSEDEDDE